MRRLRPCLLGLLACVLLPNAARGSAIPGQTCSLFGTGGVSCTPADCDFSGTLTADCDGGGDDAGGDDLLEIAGATVTCDGDILQDPNEPAAGIHVIAGSFACDVAGNGNRTTEIRLGPAGIDVQNQGTWLLQDRWIQPGDPVAYLTEPQWMIVSQVMPCPVDAASQAPADATDRGPYEPDCTNGNAHEVLLGFDDPFTDEVLAEVTPGETIWCWGEADPTKPVADTTSCYEIAQVNLADRFVSIDVRQGQPGTSYDWDQREIAEYALAAQLDAGSRVIEVDDGQGGSAFPVDYFHNARWVAFQHPERGDPDCGDGDGIPCVMGDVDQLALELSYDASSWAASAGNDTLYVADPRGARGTHPAGSRVWITYGQMRGETGSFRVPVRVTSATPPSVDHGDSAMDFSLGADIQLDGGLLDALAMDTNLANQTRMTWTWIRDPGGDGQDGCTTGRVLRLTNSEDVLLSRVSKTGGSAKVGPACDRLHGIGCPGNAANACRDFTIRDVRWRHTGDDTFVSPPGADSPLVSGYTFQRVISEFASNACESAEMFQASGWNGGTITDAYCGDCLSKVIGGSGVLGASTSVVPTTVRNVMAMGIQGVLGSFGVWDVENVSLYGADHHLKAGQGAFQGSARHFVVDHYLATFDAVASEVGRVEGAIEDGIIRRSEGRAKTAIYLETGSAMRNVLVHETKGGGAGEPVTPCMAGGNDRNCVVLAVRQSESDVWLDGVTAIGAPGMCRILSLDEGTPPNRLDGVLFTDMSETGSSCRSLHGSELAVQEAAAGADPWCFHGSQSSSSSPDVVPAALDDLPLGSLLGVDPLWIHPASDWYQPDPLGPVGLAGCGAGLGAGVPTLSWAHRLRRIGRDCLGCPTDDFPTPCANGLDDDGDGDTDFPDDPGCQDLFGAKEDPACDDGRDNDGDGGFDWDGAGQGPADPDCAQKPWRATEARSPSCGLGPSLSPLLAGLARRYARRRRRGWRPLRREGRIPIVRQLPGVAAGHPHGAGRRGDGSVLPDRLQDL